MITGIDEVTNQLARFALDRAWAQQQLSSANIANHATPGYKAMRLDFDQVLNELSAAIDVPGNDREVLALLDQAQQHVSVVSTDEDVKLDQEMVGMTRNSLNYLSLLTALEKFGALKGVAIRGGTS